MREVVHSSRQPATSPEEMYYRPHSHVKNASINTLPPSTSHYLTDSHVPPVHIHSPIQINLHHHQQLHTTTKHHICSLCSRAFIRLDSLRLHQKSCEAKASSPHPSTNTTKATNGWWVRTCPVCSTEQCYVTTDGLWTGTGHFRSTTNINTRRRLHLHSRSPLHPSTKYKSPFRKPSILPSSPTRSSTSDLNRLSTT